MLKNRLNYGCVCENTIIDTLPCFRPETDLRSIGQLPIEVLEIKVYFLASFNNLDMYPTSTIISETEGVYCGLSRSSIIYCYHFMGHSYCVPSDGNINLQIDAPISSPQIGLG